MNRTRSKDVRRKERLNTELLMSILLSNVDQVKSLLQEGANPNARCRTSYASALHIASLRGQTDIISELINAKANMKVRDRNGCYPIHLAAWAGYVTVLKVILNHDTKFLNSVVKYEEIPIVMGELDSWDHNHAEITQLLPVIKPGSSPLHIASSWNRKQTTEYLLSANADVNLKDSRGLTPLDVAGFKAGGHYNFIDHNKNATESIADQNAVLQEMYPSLINKVLSGERMLSGRSSAVVSRKHSFSGNSDVACVLPKTHSSISLNRNAEEDDFIEEEYHSTQESSTTYEVVKMLVESGAKVKDECIESESENVSNFRTNQTTTLHTAVLNNDLKLIDWLLEECQCEHMLMTINDEGNTPLHMAVKRRYFEALRNMISWLDLDTLNMSDKNGMTALYLSVDLEWLQGVSILLEAGADIKIKNYKNETVINLAIRKNNPKLLEEILSAEDEPDLLEEFLYEPMITAIENLNLTCLRLLIDYGADVNEILDDLGHTSLHKAILVGWIDGVELLLNFSADVTLKTIEKQTIYHIAAKQGNSKLFALLLKHEDSLQVLNDVDNDGLTPLYLAIQSGHLECVKSLISLNVDVTMKLPNNTNILHFAVKYFPNTKEVIHWICNSGYLKPFQLGVLLNSYNNIGMTPLSMAAKNGWLECVKAMIGAKPDIRVRNRKGVTAAHLAARYGHSNTLEELIRYDKQCLEVTDRKGWKPLHVAARNGHGNSVVLMLKYGANIASCVSIDNTQKSALDLIIHYVPMAKEKLEMLFDSYIMPVNCDKSEDEYSSVEIDYTLLLATTDENNRRQSLNKSVPLIANERGRQTMFLRTLLNCKNKELKETLLLHPLLQTYLYFKWENLKFFFTILFGCYLLYTITLTTFAILNYLAEISAFNFVLRSIIFLMLLPLTLTEIIQVKTLPKYYFQDIESWLKIFMLLTGSTIVLLSSELSASRYLASLSVLNSSIVMLFLFARFSIWGLHVLMFEKVSYNVFEVLSRFIPLFAGFLFAFMIHFDGYPPFGNFWESLCKVLIMLVELDYAGAFEEETGVNLHAIVGRLMFVAFALLVAVVIVNLILGMSVSDIAQLEMQGRSQQLKKHTSFLISLELIAYNDWIIKCIPRNLQDHINAYRTIETTKIVHPEDPRCPFSVQCKEALLRHGCNDNFEPIEKCLEQIESLTKEVEELKNLVKSSETNK